MSALASNHLGFTPAKPKSIVGDQLAVERVAYFRSVKPMSLRASGHYLLLTEAGNVFN